MINYLCFSDCPGENFYISTLQNDSTCDDTFKTKPHCCLEKYQIDFCARPLRLELNESDSTVILEDRDIVSLVNPYGPDSDPRNIMYAMVFKMGPSPVSHTPSPTSSSPKSSILHSSPVPISSAPPILSSLHILLLINMMTYMYILIIL